MKGHLLRGIDMLSADGTSQPRQAASLSAGAAAVTCNMGAAARDVVMAGGEGADRAT